MGDEQIQDPFGDAQSLVMPAQHEAPHADVDPFGNAPNFGAGNQDTALTTSQNKTQTTDVYGDNGINWGDVGRSARGQAVLGLTDVAGIPGLAAQGANWAAGKLGFEPKQEAPSVLGATYNNAYHSGDVTNFLGFPVPTPQGIEKVVKQYDPTGWSSYEPETEAGRVAGSAARFASGALETGPWGAASDASLLGRAAAAGKTAATAGAAGAGSEIAGHALDDEAAKGNAPSWAPTAARIAGAVAGGSAADVGRWALGKTGELASGIGRGIKNVAMPERTATDALSGTLGHDIQTGRAAFSPAEIQALQDAGYRTSAFDAMGPRSRSLVSYYGDLSPESRDVIGNLTNDVAGRSDFAKAQTAQHVNNLFGGDLDAPKLQSAVEAEAKATNNRLYDIARNNPAAQSIWTKGLSNIYQAKPVQNAMRDADALTTYPNSGIRGFGLMPDGSMGAPNLSYWHAVKENLDDQIGAAKRSGENNNARNLMGIKNALVGELDKAVPEYQTARNAAAEGFGATNSVEAGYNALKNTNAFKAADVQKAYASMSPDQQRLFGLGAAHYVKEQAETKGPGAVASALSNPSIAARAKMAFGQQNYDSILGHSQLANRWASVKAPSAGSTKWTPSTGINPWAGALAGAGAELALSHALGPVGAAIGYAGAKGYDAALEARTAGAAGDFLGRVADPAQAQALMQGAQRAKPAVTPPTLTNRLGDVAARRALEATRAGLVSDRSAHARGGKVGHQHLVNRLFRHVERAKREEKARTSAILQQSDTTVAKALNVAQEAI